MLKPRKTGDDPRNYRPISLHCTPYKLFERVLHHRLKPYIEATLPPDQADFRTGRNCCEQVLFAILIEKGFQENLKMGVVLLDLTDLYKN